MIDASKFSTVVKPSFRKALLANSFICVKRALVRVSFSLRTVASERCGQAGEANQMNLVLSPSDCRERKKAILDRRRRICASYSCCG